MAELDQHLDKYVRKNVDSTTGDSSANADESLKAFSEDSYTSTKDLRPSNQLQNNKPISPHASTAEIVELPDNSQQLLQRNMTRQNR